MKHKAFTLSMYEMGNAPHKNACPNKHKKTQRLLPLKGFSTNRPTPRHGNRTWMRYGLPSNLL